MTVQLESLWFCFPCFAGFAPPRPALMVCAASPHSGSLGLNRFAEVHGSPTRVCNCAERRQPVCLRGPFHEAIHSDNCAVHSLFNFLDVVAVLQ